MERRDALKKLAFLPAIFVGSKLLPKISESEEKQETKRLRERLKQVKVKAELDERQKLTLMQDRIDKLEKAQDRINKLEKALETRPSVYTPAITTACSSDWCFDDTTTTTYDPNCLTIKNSDNEVLFNVGSTNPGTRKKAAKRMEAQTNAQASG